MKQFIFGAFLLLGSGLIISGLFEAAEDDIPKYKLNQKVRFKQKDFYIGVCSDRGIITDYINTGFGGDIYYEIKTPVCDESCDCPYVYSIKESNVIGVFND